VESQELAFHSFYLSVISTARVAPSPARLQMLQDRQALQPEAAEAVQRFAPGSAPARSISSKRSAAPVTTI